MKYLFLKFAVTIPAFFVFILVVVGIIEAGGSAIWSLILGIPFVGSLCYFYRCMDRLDADERKASKKSPPSVPSPVKPVARSVIPARDAAPSYRVCHFIWARSIIFCGHILDKPSLKCVTCMWTAFFYSITKHIRNQDLVDEIYAQFKFAAEPFIKDGENVALSLHYIQSTYWQFRSALNASGIDPRTQDGISKLWDLTAQWSFPNVQLPEGAQDSFSYNVHLLANHALTLYGLKPSAETVYYTESANGMTVRVPESKLDAWQNAQEGLGKKPTEEQRKYIKQKILQEIYGSDQQDK